MNLGYVELVVGLCILCVVVEDKLVYWFFQMYFKYEDGIFEEVIQVGGMFVYYFFNKDVGNLDKGVKVFFNGFCMVVGDSNCCNYFIGSCNFKDVDFEKFLWVMFGEMSQEDFVQCVVGFNCFDYNKIFEGVLVCYYFFEKGYFDGNCFDGICLEFMFFLCWNGKDLDLVNYKFYVVYFDFIMDGWCFKGFDIKFFSLMFEIIYEINKFKGIFGEFVMVNGDVQGMF